MKKIFTGCFKTVLLCLALALFAASCVSPRPFASAFGYPGTPPPGFVPITQNSLRGTWENDDGELLAFKDGLFQSTIYNEGKIGRYVINPVFDSYLLAFYSDRNVEYEMMFGQRFYFLEGSLEKRNLDSLFALLSDDQSTLILGETFYYKVGE